LEVEEIRLHIFGLVSKTKEIFLEAFEAAGRLLNRRHRSTGQDQLRRLSAGCRTAVGHPLAPQIPQEPSRNAGRRILDPPFSLFEAVERRYGAAKLSQSDAPRRQDPTVQAISP